MWQEVEAAVREEAKNNIPKAQMPKYSKWLTNVATNIANMKREAKKQHARQDESRTLNAECQRQARKDKEEYLNRACKEIWNDNKK